MWWLLLTARFSTIEMTEKESDGSDSHGEEGACGRWGV